jgi:DNA-binding beta-propeller fold protein YncE
VRTITRLLAGIAPVLLVLLVARPVFASFVAFESGHVRPLAMSPDGTRLFVVNTPDNRLEIFSLDSGEPVATGSVPVGMEPVAVAARNNSEIWVVNHLSDSISIVDVAAIPPRVVRTLLVGDEPRDIVFAGPGGSRAFITTAHRGQNSPYDDPSNPGELTTPGIGRADVWVFDATAPGAGIGGNPLTIVTLFGDTPRPLAVSPDGATVYAGVFHSGNQTTALHEGAVCNGGATAGSCVVDGATAPGGLPAPNVDSNNQLQPEVGLIVKYDGVNWKDELGRNWDGLVRFDLPDKDVFAINANANPPVETAWVSGVGTVLYNMAVSPTSGKLFVANTEAINEVRFEGTRTAAQSSISTVIGRQHETRISIIDPGLVGVTPRHLNKHINYAVSPAPAGTAENSLALPRQLVISGDGKTLYVAAKGSDKVGIFDVAKLENDTFVPDSANHVHVSGGGPSGLLLDEARGRLYVTTRFDNGISIIDTVLEQESTHIQLANPEPANITSGRRFLYDANLSSSNGEAACASCHVDGDLDSLAWDLGDPTGSILNNPLDFFVIQNPAPPVIYKNFHPMKGPMTTQTLRGMDGHGSMHWRGDRTGGNDETNSAPNGDGGAYNEVLSFKKFGGAFEGLLGRTTPASDAEMQVFADFILKVQQPPNPVRALDDSLTAMQAAGQTFYQTQVSDIVSTCNGCHVLDPANGFFGTNGQGSFENEPQHLKVPHLRNMYSKVGMFGMPAVSFFNAGDNAHKGDQIRGFGFTHDGSTDSLLRFLNASLFGFPGGDAQRKQVEQFMFAFDSNLKPVVGQQVTLDSTNCCETDPPSKSPAQLRAELLIAQAAAGNADLVVKGIQNGEARGWRRLSDSAFESDRASESPLSETALFTIAATPGQPLGFMAVPPGSGLRIGIDRDEDGVLDNDDNCPTVAIASQLDTDNDGAGNVCDTDDDNDGLTDDFETGIGSNSLLADTDGDGLSDGEEVGYDGDITRYTPGSDTSPLLRDTDGDGIDDDVDPVPLNFNYMDGDVAPIGNPDGSINAADYLVMSRMVLGLVAADTGALAHGDLYPVGAPDGKITLSDLILLGPLVLP